MSLMNFLISMICLLISVAFYTVMERKILSYIQIRKGPNKVGMLGILQPFSDAIKLFNKNLVTSELMNFSLSYITPSLALLIPVLILPIILYNGISIMDNKQNILFFLILSSMSVFLIIMIGWSANSKYCHLGVIRSLAQMISYEVSFFLIVLFISIMSNSYSFLEINKSQTMLWFLWGNMVLFCLWMTSCMAEVNRSPFDFTEGESELVSGFNVEYMGGWFALIFLAEYSNMLILSIITTILFMNATSSLMSIIMLLLTTMLMLWMRGTYPRFRYDMLMKLNWKIFLTTILFLITLSISIQAMYF